MKAIWRFFRAAPPSQRSQAQVFADRRPFEAGDIVLLRHKKDRAAPPILTKPLRAGKRMENHRGYLNHDAILGARVRDVVRTQMTRAGREGDDYRIHEVRLEEYVALSRRLVTPIYPPDAQVITGLFDLHPETPDPGDLEDGAPKLEILEAGTGHGALTLYLSRAIHAANPALKSSDVENKGVQAQWKANRRAVIHSIELVERTARHAEEVVKGFRHGMYARNVDFHVGNVGAWISEALVARNGQPFLSHAFLDMPQAQAQFANVAKALRADGTLVVFNPSITQILECTTMIRNNGIPLELERVIELGVNGTTGGREWDVRLVRPRAGQREAQSSAQDTESVESPEKGETSRELDAVVDVTVDKTGEVARVDSEATADQADDVNARNGQWSTVCRPKVGERIVGGGFLGVWKKQRRVDSA